MAVQELHSESTLMAASGEKAIAFHWAEEKLSLLDY